MLTRIKFVVIFACLFSSFVLHAQKQVIKFDTETFDFGDVKSGNKVRTIFTFTNVTEQALSLKSVKGGCVCTRPIWNEAPVEPGKTGKIEVEFDSKKGKIGEFMKSVVIQTTANEQVDMIYIKGKVVPSKPTAAWLNPKYRYAQGYLNFRDPAIPLTTIQSNNDRMFWIYVENTSPKPMLLTLHPDNPEHIRMESEKAIRIKSGDTDSFRIVFDGRLLNRKTDGYISDTLRLITDDSDNPIKKLPLVGSFKRVYTQEELNKAPKIEFEYTTYDAGKIIQGDKMNHAFKFKNTGGSELLITGAKPSCGCTASAPENTEIPPGESSQINISFDSAGRNGMQTKTVTVSSNDPLTPSLVLTFTCEIVEDPFKGPGLGN